MGLATNGDLIPHLTGNCPPSCKACTVVCPFSDGPLDSRPTNRELFARTAGAAEHPDIGCYIDAFVGHVQAPEHRWHSASGGFATWCLEQLLATGEIDRVAVVVPLAGPGARFGFAPIERPQDVFKSAGSVYQPVECSDIIKGLLAEPVTKWAIIGVPCLCAAVRRHAVLRRRIRFVLGLACGMYQNAFYTEFLARAAGQDPDGFESCRYRVKDPARRPNDYGFACYSGGQPIGHTVRYTSLPYFLGRHGYFRLGSCDACTDVFAEAADACFMDAWLPEYCSDPRGTSIVLLRNTRLAEIFAAGVTCRAIDAKRLPAAQVALSQFGATNRKRRGIHNSSCLFSFLDKRAQLATRRRSKFVWRTVARRLGPAALWLSMIDLLAVQVALGFALPLLIRCRNQLQRVLVRNR
ncbi:MAG: Coenzyme F420 hydrogenase/dehydrogenase, beta subunit C-terminal domain [Terriglobales bacterium]